MIENLSLVIPYRNECAALKRLLKTLPIDVPVIVVDDQSDVLPEVEGANVKVIRPVHRGWFAGAVNAGIQACETDVLVLNQDIWFDDGRWEDVVRAAQAKRYGITGHGVLAHPAWPRGYVQGTFMFLAREAIKQVGLLDVIHWPLWGGTAEWQLRACRKGFTAWPLATIPGMGHEERHGAHYGASIAKQLQDDPQSQSLMIRTPPLVTVVVPTYNQAKYLPDVLGSLIGGQTCLGKMPGQTFQGFEVVIVDDCGKDETPEVMKTLADPWKGIRYVRLGVNKGTAGAINRGVAEGFGRYYTVLAGDDMLEADALERLLTVCEADDHAVAYGDQQIMVGGKRSHIWKMRDYDFEELVQRNHVPAGIMTTKAAWKAVGGYPEEFRHGREDWAMAVALGRAGYCGKHVNKPLYIYRRMGQNRSLTNSTAEWRQTFVAMMAKRFPDIYGGERPMGCCGGAKGGGARAMPKGMPGAQPQGQRNAAQMPGKSGMVLLEYIGLNVGRTNWQGDVTHTKYTFSAGHKVMYVFADDVPGMLAQLYDRKPAFRRFTQPVPKPAPAPLPKAVPAAPAPVVDEVDPLTGVVEPEPQAAPDADIVEHMSSEPPVEAEPTKPRRVRRRKGAGTKVDAA